ncbi:hypothetical protein, no similarity [Maudiozyma saulgeensis]|uniref:Uncharacterized protein n=1 Tax=Maudiozyma saulgeensis TaxID=1789683 RepID=A0A1X7R3R4_9SACH|nr:hypothetical protein, no similarity [Kazachstania saulgeensis]
MSRRSVTVLYERPIQKRDLNKRATTIVPDAISINDLKMEIFSLTLDNEKPNPSNELEDSETLILDDSGKLYLNDETSQSKVEETYSSDDSDVIGNQTFNVDNCIINTNETYIQNLLEKDDIEIVVSPNNHLDPLSTKEETSPNIRSECDMVLVCNSNDPKDHQINKSHEQEINHKSTEQYNSEDNPDCQSVPTNHYKLIHKPLKQLIYQTNRSLYNVDSSRVQHRAGLSKSAIGLPSLHPNRTR